MNENRFSFIGAKALDWLLLLIIGIVAVIIFYYSSRPWVKYATLLLLFVMFYSRLPQKLQKYGQLRYWWLHLITTFMVGSLYFFLKIAFLKYMLFILVSGYSIMLLITIIGSVISRILLFFKFTKSGFKYGPLLIKSTLMVILLITSACTLNYIHSFTIKAILLSTISYILIFTVLQSLKKMPLPFLLIPNYTVKATTASGSVALGAIYYICLGQSRMGQFLWMLLLLSGLYGLFINCYLTIANSIIIRKIVNNKSLHSAMNIPYVMLDFTRHAGFSHLIKKFIVMTTQILWRFKYSHSKANPNKDIALDSNTYGDTNFIYYCYLEFREFLSGFRRRLFAVFIEISDIEKFPSTIRKRIIRHAAAYVGLIESYSALKQNGDLHRNLHLCLGPSILLNFRDDENRLIGYEVICGEFFSDRIGNMIAPFTDILSTSALPLSTSDRKLREEYGDFMNVIAERGFPPIADCYLRFRLAKSSVERFLCILEGFELLTKTSAIILVSNRFHLERKPFENISSRLSKPPAFGTWKDFLRELLKQDISTEYCRQIRDAWYSPLQRIPLNMKEIINALGLSWKGNFPQNLFEFIEWVVWLRNITRGHGGVEEKSMASIWHNFHAMFLEMIHLLAIMTIYSHITVLDANGDEHNLRGWLRGDVRSDLAQLDNCLLYPYINNDALRNKSIALSPLFLCRGNSCLVWNGNKSNAIEYFDYATGVVNTADLPLANFFDLLKNGI